MNLLRQLTLDDFKDNTEKCIKRIEELKVATEKEFKALVEQALVFANMEISMLNRHEELDRSKLSSLAQKLLDNPNLSISDLSIQFPTTLVKDEEDVLEADSENIDYEYASQFRGQDLGAIKCSERKRPYYPRRKFLTVGRYIDEEKQLEYVLKVAPKKISKYQPKTTLDKETFLNIKSRLKEYFKPKKEEEKDCEM